MGRGIGFPARNRGITVHYDAFCDRSFSVVSFSTTFSASFSPHGDARAPEIPKVYFGASGEGTERGRKKKEKKRKKKRKKKKNSCPGGRRDFMILIKEPQRWLAGEGRKFVGVYAPF